jgi:shikimate dehydrogenase
MLVSQAKRVCELFLGESIDDREIDAITRSIANEMGNIILVGMPGCGKSTVAHLLAKLTGRDLLDTDEMITAASGRTPSEIIKTDGEDDFRKIEHEQILIAGKTSGKIISTGGGVVTRQENYEPLHQNGKIFFIKRPLHCLSTLDRPLSQTTPLEDMYSDRLPKYRSFCDHEVSNEHQAESCAEEIIKLSGVSKK